MNILTPYCELDHDHQVDIISTMFYYHTIRWDYIPGTQKDKYVNEMLDKYIRYITYKPLSVLGTTKPINEMSRTEYAEMMSYLA